MKKTSNIFLTIGTVFSFLSGALLLVFGALFIVIGSSKEAIIQGLESGAITTTMEGTTIEIANTIQAVSIALGIIFLIGMLINITAGILAIIAKKKGTKGLYILNTIFGTISAMSMTLVGGILGLINKHKENRQLAFNQ